MRDKRPTKTIIGLDIGTRAIKALELSSEDKARRITNLKKTVIPFPLGSAETAAALHELLESFRPSKKEASISLSAPQAMVRFVSMPRMTQADLKNSIRFEAERYIPFNVDDVILDAVTLDENGESKNQMKVVLAAAKKDAVKSRMELAGKEGLSVSAIDIDSFACFNAFSRAMPRECGFGSIALLNMGFTQTNVLIAREGSPFFTRDIQIGAKDTVKKIASELEVTEEEAGGFLINPGDKAGRVRELAGPALNDLADELRLSFGYYENQSGKSVSAIYLSGGFSRYGAVPGHIEERFGIKPESWNPLAGFEAESGLDRGLLENEFPQFAVCAGLALRS